MKNQQMENRRDLTLDKDFTELLPCLLVSHSKFDGFHLSGHNIYFFSSKKLRIRNTLHGDKVTNMAIYGTLLEI